MHIIDYHSLYNVALRKPNHHKPNPYPTMTFALLARRTTLLATRRATASASSSSKSSAAMTKRRMGGSAAPAPEWEGIDKVVRGYFPQDDQREFILLCMRRGVLFLSISFDWINGWEGGDFVLWLIILTCVSWAM